MINNQIDKNESIKIETKEAVVYRENDIENSALKEDQIKIIASFLKKNFIDK